MAFQVASRRFLGYVFLCGALAKDNRYKIYKFEERTKQKEFFFFIPPPPPIAKTILQKRPKLFLKGFTVVFLIFSKTKKKDQKIISQGIYSCFLIFSKTKKKAKKDQKFFSQRIYCFFFIFSQTKKKNKKKRPKKCFSKDLLLFFTIIWWKQQ